MNDLDLKEKYRAACETIKKQAERIKQLEELFGLPEVPPQLGLSLSESRLLKALMSRGLWHKEALFREVYSDRYHEDDCPDLPILDVFVHKIRKKLKPFGFKITTCWGVGYALPPETRVALKHMAREAADAMTGAAA